MAKTTKRDPYEIEQALHHLTRAEEIRRDADLMGHVKKHAAEKKAALSRVASMSPRNPPKRK